MRQIASAGVDRTVVVGAVCASADRPKLAPHSHVPDVLLSCHTALIVPRSGAGRSRERLQHQQVVRRLAAHAEQHAALAKVRRPQ